LTVLIDFLHSLECKVTKGWCEYETSYLESVSLVLSCFNKGEFLASFVTKVAQICPNFINQHYVNLARYCRVCALCPFSFHNTFVFILFYAFIYGLILWIIMDLTLELLCTISNDGTGVTIYWQNTINALAIGTWSFSWSSGIIGDFLKYWTVFLCWFRRIKNVGHICTHSITSAFIFPHGCSWSIVVVFPPQL
jgi:hypothetical protein